MPLGLYFRTPGCGVADIYLRENVKLPLENVKLPLENVKLPLEKVKLLLENVKLPLEQAMQVHRGSRGIGLPFL